MSAGAIEFKQGRSHSFYVDQQTIRQLQEEFHGVDVEDALKDAAHRSRNLSLVDRKAVFLFIRNHLALARTKAAQKASAINEARAKSIQKPKETPIEPPKKETAAVPEVEPVHGIERRLPQRGSRTVELFRSRLEGSTQVMIQTTASSIDVFIPALSMALSEAIHNEPDNVDDLIKNVLRMAFPLGMKIAGYKIESVKEERILISGYVPPNETDIVGQAD